MRLVPIPNTDLRVSQICLGTSDFGTNLNEAQSFALADEFVRLGGNFLDTAHIYGDIPRGTNSESERTIGAWLTARGSRKDIIIGTKGAHPDLKSMHVPRLSPEDIAHDLNESLDHLQTDYIDLYWLHRDGPSVPVGEIVDALDEQVNAGKIRYFGGSNWEPARLQAALDYSARTGKASFVASQPLWGLAVPNELSDKTLAILDEDGVAFHKRTQMAVMPYSSQAHGFFTKLDNGTPLPKNDVAQYDNATNRARLPRVQALAQKHGVLINDIVLAYLWSQPFPSIPIIGNKNADRLRANVAHADLTLTPEEIAWL
jgi:aryl-alcohol dehydrogenase-like predicted oxidoreductase